MHRKSLSVLIIALPFLMAAAENSPPEPAFKIAGANVAVADRDRAIARAAAVYKQSVMLAEKQCDARMAQFAASPAAQNDADEKARIQLARDAIAKIIAECTDAKFTAMIVSVETANSVAQGLHKGMTKAELLGLFPDKPESDTTDADGGEQIEWVKRETVASGGGFDPDGGGITQSFSSRMVNRTVVTLKGGIVVDFSVQKN